MSAPDLVTCPLAGCGAPAELIDRWNFSSTAGPVPHVRTACLQGHVFTVRQESVARAPEPPAATGRRDRVRR